ncbi:uncharacterized protein LOC110469389 [Lonchura striata]
MHCLQGKQPQGFIWNPNGLAKMLLLGENTGLMEDRGLGTLLSLLLSVAAVLHFFLRCSPDGLQSLSRLWASLADTGIRQVGGNRQGCSEKMLPFCCSVVPSSCVRLKPLQVAILC